MNNLSTSALLGAMALVLMLTLSACTSASKYEPAPAAAPPMYEPKPDRN